MRPCFGLWVFVKFDSTDIEWKVLCNIISSRTVDITKVFDTCWSIRWFATELSLFREDLPVRRGELASFGENPSTMGVIAIGLSIVLNLIKINKILASETHSGNYSKYPRAFGWIDASNQCKRWPRCRVSRKGHHHHNYTTAACRCTLATSIIGCH